MMWEFILRLLVAVACGTVIGLDREYRVKDAGFRTHFLVSLGSALMMIVSQYGFEGLLGREGVGFDPSRIASQVVSGIGFIGAGTIIFHRQIVRGLTTAASLWATAGIGLAVGAGMYGLGVAAAVLTLVGLEGLSLIFRGVGMRRTVVVFSTSERGRVDAQLDALKAEAYSILSFEVAAGRGLEGEPLYRATLVIQARTPHDENRFLEVLRADPKISVERIA